MLDDVGGFNAGLSRNEDQEWLFRVCLAGWRIAGIDAELVDYRTSPTGLAADIDALLADFELVLIEARRRAPGLVAALEPRARARTHRYLARRALRLGVDRKTARRHMGCALRHAPGLLVSEPRATIATLLAAMLPASPLFAQALG